MMIDEDSLVFSTQNGLFRSPTVAREALSRVSVNTSTKLTLVAFTVAKPFLAAFPLHGGHPETLAEPHSQTELESDGWRLAGFDVVDNWSSYSAIFGCGVSVWTSERLRIGKKLNQNGLFDSLTLAEEFNLEIDELIPPHAPFFIGGVMVKDIIV